MSQAAAQPRYVRESTAPLLVGAVVLSVLVHGGMLAYLSLRPSAPPMVVQKPVELVMFEVEPPKPPEPPKEEPPPPEPPKVKVKPPPIKVAKTEAPPPPPEEQAPPPPNEPPPPETPQKPVPLVVGISMSSTTTSGGFAAPVGNTLYGKTADKAANPSEVKAYSAPKYAPIYQVDSEPSLEFRPAFNNKDYPPDARRAEIEGRVQLVLTIDDHGKVVKARVLKGLGYGCDDKAIELALLHRFKPAIKGGERVSTEMPWSIVFELND